MSRDYEKEFNKSIESLRFSSDAKKRLYDRLICSDTKRSEREDRVMKKWTLPKIAAVAVATLFMTGGVAFAAGQIVSTYSRASIFDYKYDHDDTDLINTKAGIEAIMPNEFSTGFAFDKAAVLNVDGKDTDGNTVSSWPEINIVYVNPANEKLSLSIEDAAFSSGIDYETATMIKEINGIQVVYNLDEYLFLPPSAEENGLSQELQERLDNDPHFYVSIGSAEEEHSFHRGVVFIKDDIYYHLFGMDTDLTADDFFSMAADIIGE